MKEKTFWRVLKEMGLKWTAGDRVIPYANKKGVVRAVVKVAMGMGVERLKPVCPITAVCFEETGCYYPVMRWEQAASDLGLDEMLADGLVSAADSKILHDPRIREMLLEAVGLEGEPI
jgi:hypothetical protein